MKDEKLIVTRGGVAVDGADRGHVGDIDHAAQAIGQQVFGEGAK